MKRRRSVNSTTAAHHSRRPPQVGEPVADDERRAAGVAARERVARLAAEGHGHRLVEQPHPSSTRPCRTTARAELRERHALHVGVGRAS